MRTSKALAATSLALLSVLLIRAQSSPLPQELNDGHAPSLVKTLAFSNDWNCEISSDHPRPLILIHGILGNIQMHLLFMASFFKSKGYCVFALNHGAFLLPVINGMDKMENSAQQVSVFTDKVLKATGADKVDLLGYSAGTMVAQYYLKRLNGALKVEKHAGIAPIHYGTTFQKVSTVLKSLGLFDGVKEVISPICESCHQVITNSTFINDLYADGDAVPGVQYLMVATVTDEFVSPYTNGFLRSLGPNVHNQLLQDWCPNDLTGHPVLQANLNAFNGVDAFFTSSTRPKCEDPPLMIPALL